MRSCSIIFRPAALLLLVDIAARATAQNTTNGSPYSAYGFGDLFNYMDIPSALMGGVGVAFTEPFSVLSSNPASYAGSPRPALGGLQRPVFETGLRSVFLEQRSATGSSHRRDAQFEGFSLGVPFGRNRWGMAFGLTPYSNVGYSLRNEQQFEGGTVSYEYSGSGGLSRIYAGAARTLLQHKVDSLGNLGSRLVFGANFEFLFGGIEQTRKAIYPTGQAFTNTSAYASLVLRAPTGSLGLLYSDDLISTTKTNEARQRRIAREQARIDRWKVEHVDTLRMPAAEYSHWSAAATQEERINWLHHTAWRPEYTDSTRLPIMRQFPERRPWRWTLGATTELPTAFSATRTDLVTTFTRGRTGVETVIDTLPSNGTAKGSLILPPAYGVGLSVHNDRWMITVEARRRDWSGLKVDVDGYDLPSTLRASTVYAAGARFTPATEGGLFRRTTYRAGLRYTDDYVEVRGTSLTRASASLGASFPLNQLQTNSYFHIGAEYGQRGTTRDGLLQETSVNLWIGLSITPRRGRGEGDWFQRRQIQ